MIHTRREFYVIIIEKNFTITHQTIMKPIQFDRAFYARFNGVFISSKRFTHVEKNAIL
jgi:hypothetical protein